MWAEGEYEQALQQCKRNVRTDNLPILAIERLDEYFNAMRNAYAGTLHKSVLEPVRTEFKILCMKATLDNIAPETFDDEISKQIKISEIYQYNFNRGVIKYPLSNPDSFNLSTESRKIVEPRITQLVKDIYADMCTWVAGLAFKNHKDIMAFLNTFESNMSNQSFAFQMGWPNDVFATFRTDFLMRDDFKIKFPVSDSVNLVATKEPFPNFQRFFPIETLVSIAYTDDEKAMKKWLKVSGKWLSDETGTCCMLETLDHLVLNNASKCIQCITSSVYDKHMRKSSMDVEEGKDGFIRMLNDSLSIDRPNERRSFGYVGPVRWSKMTPAFLKAVYTHPLAIGSKLCRVPRGVPLYSMWVRVVRWARVKAYVQARSAIVYMMQLVAERECRAAFAEDGSAMLLGDVARGDRVSHAAANGVAFEPLNDGKTPAARGATASFNLALQKSMELIEKSRLERAEAQARAEAEESEESDSSDGEAEEADAPDEGAPSAKRARVEA
jgi:hypothetical protein